MTAPLGRRLFAELLGSAFHAAPVIGSGIAAQQLSPGNVGMQLLENAAATAAGLFTIILMFGPISGGHFNLALVSSHFRRDHADWRLLPRRASRRRHARSAALHRPALVAATLAPHVPLAARARARARRLHRRRSPSRRRDPGPLRDRPARCVTSRADASAGAMATAAPATDRATAASRQAAR